MKRIPGYVCKSVNFLKGWFSEAAKQILINL